MSAGPNDVDYAAGGGANNADDSASTGAIETDDTASGGAAEVDEGRRRLVQWLWRVPVIAAAAGGGYGLYEAIRVHFRKFDVDQDPEFDPRPDQLVSELAAFAEVWDSVTFEVPAAAPGQAPVPAVAVRLPGPVPGGIALETGLNVASAYLAAFSRICTHQHCIVSLNRDIDAINLGFNYQTRSPALT
ncbi:MAG: hypothetical protein WCY60_10920, partial [Trueperaceae bacterium]